MIKVNLGYYRLKIYKAFISKHKSFYIYQQISQDKYSKHLYLYKCVYTMLKIYIYTYKQMMDVLHEKIQSKFEINISF